MNDQRRFPYIISLHYRRDMDSDKLIELTDRLVDGFEVALCNQKTQKTRSFRLSCDLIDDCGNWIGVRPTSSPLMTGYRIGRAVYKLLDEMHILSQCDLRIYEDCLYSSDCDVRKRSREEEESLVDVSIPEPKRLRTQPNTPNPSPQTLSPKPDIIEPVRTDRIIIDLSVDNDD